MTQLEIIDYEKRIFDLLAELKLIREKNLELEKELILFKSYKLAAGTDYVEKPLSTIGNPYIENNPFSGRFGQPNFK